MYHYIIVDDEKLTREGILEKMEGVSDLVSCVGQAQDGVDALVLTERLHPDIIITDMKMPVLGGERLLPILAEKYPEIAIIAISGYQDTDYFRQAIRSSAVDYILKPIKPEEICQAVKKAVQRLEHKEGQKRLQEQTKENLELTRYAYDREVLRNMIAGYSYGDYVPGAVQLQDFFDKKSVILATLYSETVLVQDEIRKIIPEMNGMEILFLPHMYAENLGFLVIALTPCENRKAQDLCRMVFEKMLVKWPVNGEKLICGVGAVHESSHELHRAFSESIEALNQMKPDQKEDIYFYSADIPAPHQLPFPGIEELLFCMEAGRTAEVERLVEEMFLYFQGVGERTLADIKRTCTGISGRARYILENYVGAKLESSQRHRVQNVLDTLFSEEELKDYYMQFFKNIAVQLEKCSVYTDNDAVQNVKIYMDKNYQRNISVEFLASIFHMNRSYLSFIFKHKMKVSCIDYLNQVRIIHAKELLKQTDKKMYQIARQVGYNNVSYFYRAFKKVEGMTPEQYRQG